MHGRDEVEANHRHFGVVRALHSPSDDVVVVERWRQDYRIMYLVRLGTPLKD